MRRVSMVSIGLFLLSSALLPVRGMAAIQYPLHVSTDGRRVLDASGQSIGFQAASPWHLAARLTREEVVEYLDARAAQGFNAILMSLMVTDGYSTGSTQNAYGERPFRSPGDFLRPNPKYFDHVDWVLQQAQQRQMTVFLAPLYLGYECGPEGWCAQALAAGPDVMREFGRWVGTRYRDQPNLVWLEGGDVDAGQYGAMEVMEAVVEGIQETDPDHLHTAHCSRGRSGRDCYDRPWLDLDTTYGDCTMTPRRVLEDGQRQPPMPRVYIEGRYEFEGGASEVCVRSQAWWAALGGSAGQFYGSGRIWDFVPGWRDGLQTAGTSSMQILEQILRTRAWPELVPDFTHQFLVDGYGDVYGSDYAAAATTTDHNTLLAYLPSARSVTVDLGAIAGDQTEVCWVRADDGSVVFGGRYTDAGLRTFSPPSSGDWVLVIDNVAAGLPVVGSVDTAAPPAAVDLRLAATPNPFNPATTLDFRAPAGQPVRIDVFDARGRRRQHLFEGRATGDEQTLRWAPRSLESGVYYLRIRAADSSSVREVTLLK